MDDNTYLLLKGLHILGVVAFLGNITVTGWWKVMADRTRNPAVIAFAQRQVTLTDYVFTAGGVVLLLVGGVGNAMLHGMDISGIRWLVVGNWLFIISGIIWATILIPVQAKQAKMARQLQNGAAVPESCWRLARIWNVFGARATFIPMANIWWMVSKPM